MWQKAARGGSSVSPSEEFRRVLTLFATRSRASDRLHCRRDLGHGKEVELMSLEQLEALDASSEAAEMAASLGSQSC
ncbi:microvionin family RiPP [Microbacterium arborescens]|uniref:microvionin family RiPP n=1 Tax=Microbacterium arborescens TaxID=33883 RepID=UPI0033424E6F